MNYDDLFDPCDHDHDKPSPYVFASFAIVFGSAPTETTATLTVGRHTFRFHGPPEDYERWHRHMSRCRRDYETRMAMRAGKAAGRIA